MEEGEWNERICYKDLISEMVTIEEGEKTVGVKVFFIKNCW